MVKFRPAASGDWKDIRRICCETGASGKPIEAARWPFFAEQWIGPYQRLLPDWAFVAESDGAVVGYLTGCPDTQTFKWRRRLLFAAPLLARAAAGRFGYGADVRRYMKRAARLERSPDRSFGSSESGQVSLWSKLDREFPAHLHVNVDAACRGDGVGRHLVDAFCDRLRGQCTPGVHVFCGAAPVKFYASVGFQELATTAFHPPGHAATAPVSIYCLGRRL